MPEPAPLFGVDHWDFIGVGTSKVEAVNFGEWVGLFSAAFYPTVELWRTQEDRFIFIFSSHLQPFPCREEIPKGTRNRRLYV